VEIQFYPIGINYDSPGHTPREKKINRTGNLKGFINIGRNMEIICPYRTDVLAFSASLLILKK